jgi:hypothetical protein
MESSFYTAENKRGPLLPLHTHGTRGCAEPFLEATSAYFLLQISSLTSPPPDLVYHCTSEPHIPLKVRDVCNFIRAMSLFLVLES